MELIIYFTGLVLFFTACIWGYELWFRCQQKKEDERNNKNANFDYDKHATMTEDIFGDML